MDHTYDDIVLLERFLEGSLSGEQSRIIEERLAKEPALQELYANEQLLVKGIRVGHLRSTLAFLKNHETTLPRIAAPAKEGKAISLTKYWKPMAVAAAVITFMTTFLLWDRQLNPEEIFAAHFKPYPNIFEPVLRGTTTKTSRAEAFAAYERGDYAKAAEGFRILLDSSKEPEILLLLGNANLMLGNTEEAQQNFLILSKEFDTLDPVAKWYLSLSYLKMGNQDSARVLLEDIAAVPGPYQEKSKALLKKIQ